ncbi:hypothetical protein UT300007_26470 [Clostridium sp. CTA-7]
MSNSVISLNSLLSNELNVLGTRLYVLQLLDIKFLGVVLIGILMSRGSNFIHDLLVKITNIKAK